MFSEGLENILLEFPLLTLQMPLHASECDSSSTPSHMGELRGSSGVPVRQVAPSCLRMADLSLRGLAKPL